jgi:cardiolipin synthase
MYHYNWKKELLTIPNFLSLFRLLLIPVYIRMYLTATSDLDHYLAGTVLGLSCLTDLADGKIAREYNMVSNVGKLLDPLADKLTQLALILSLVKKHRLLYGILGLFLIKELFQSVALVIFARQGKVLSGALFSGKICTAVLFGSLLLLVLFPRLDTVTVQLLIMADGIFLLLAFGSYIHAYFGNSEKLTDYPID